MKVCKFKEKFIGYGTQDGLCPYDFPDCLRKVKVCHFHDKLQDLRIDTESIMAEYRAERGGKD